MMISIIITRIASGGARRAIDEFERVFENRGERERLIDTVGLQFTTLRRNRGDHRRRSCIDGGNVGISDERWRHCLQRMESK